VTAPSRPGLVYLAGLGIIAGLHGLGICGVYQFGHANLVILALFAVCLSLGFTQRFFVPGMVGLVSGALAVAMAARVIAFEAGSLVTVAVDQAPAHPEASAFVFTDGRAKRAFVGVHQSGSTKNKKYFSVAPLVSPGWTKADPVRVWASCITLQCEADFDLKWNAGLRDTVWVADYRRAVAAAEQTHGIRGASDAVFVNLVKDPLEEVQFFRLCGVGAVVLGQLIWVGISLGGTLTVRRWFRRY
jgi:hypothetical protein